ncbi:MAG: hypothetical protein RI904_2239 [Pseudomonadota bacterium]|jgi:hypothetical protein
MSQKSTEELLRRTDITCGARYSAAHRMELQGWAAQWTLALLAIGQIIITLIPALKLRSNFGEAYVGFASVLFAVLVLAYSLLLGMANYSARAVKMHGCGLELGRLARRLFFLINRGNTSAIEYEECAKSYYDILDKHENHTKLDYLISHHQHYGAKASILEFSDKKYWRERASLALVKVKIWTLQTIQFSHFAISFILMYGWIYCMVRQ